MIRAWQRSIGLLLLCLPLLTGCWNMKEIEHMFYAHALGVDFVNNRYVIYVQVLDFTALAKGEMNGGSGNSKTPLWVGKGEGDTLDEAAHDLYQSAQRRIYWGHLNGIILSESALRHHSVREILDMINRYHETRYSAWIFATRIPVLDLLTNPPILENSPVFSKLSDPRDSFYQSSFLEYQRLHRFLAMLDDPAHTSLLTTLNLAKSSWFDVKKRKKPSIFADGVCYLEKGKWKAWFSRQQLTGLRWLRKSTTRTDLVIKKKGRPVATLIFEDPEVKLIPSVQQNQALFDLKLEVTGNIIELPGSVSEQFLRQQAAKQIEEDIRQLFSLGLQKGADLLDLSQTLYKKDAQTWHRLVQNGLLPLNANSLRTVDVRIHLVSSGMNILKIE